MKEPVKNIYTYFIKFRTWQLIRKLEKLKCLYWFCNFVFIETQMLSQKISNIKTNESLNAVSGKKLEMKLF